MLTLYPDIKPYVNHTLAVDARHTLHIEECGNPEGLPVVFVHGGPGSGCEPYHRRFFDPNVYRIVLFDQRGAGRSTPHAELTDNTTQHLVADMEEIRVHLGIERWAVFGGSWGSTLALVYAETYPERVLGLILRGIFLCTPGEIRWFYQDGANRLFPDYWEDYLKPVAEEERGDMVGAYYRLLTGGNEIARMAAAKAWSTSEGRCSTLKPKTEHNSFLDPGQILLSAHTLRNIPGVIVHGRYDVVCPVENAWRLKRAWPEAELKIIADAGHSATEPGTVNALVAATIKMADRLT